MILSGIELFSQIAPVERRGRPAETFTNLKLDYNQLGG